MERIIVQCEVNKPSSENFIRGLSRNCFTDKVYGIFNLPYKDRLKPVNELFFGFLFLGYDEKAAKRILRAHGVSRSLLFRLDVHKRMQC